MSRFSEAFVHMRNRLRQVKGETATITRDGATLASDVDVVQVDLDRIVRTESEFLLEEDDVGFLIGVDQVPAELVQGDLIAIGSRRYRIQERQELEITWLWHDTARTQRVYFAKEWTS